MNIKQALAFLAIASLSFSPTINAARTCAAADGRKFTELVLAPRGCTIPPRVLSALCGSRFQSSPGLQMSGANVQCIAGALYSASTIRCLHGNLSGNIHSNTLKCQE